MKASELRIGNLFDYHRQTVHVMSIGDLSAEFGYFVDSVGFLRSYMEDDCPKYVPLTEEWLLKFGFRKRKACGNYWFEKSHKKLLFLTNDINSKKGFAFATKLDHVFIYDLNWNKRVKYVHQLQNLYFALTGEELTIKKF